LVASFLVGVLTGLSVALPGRSILEMIEEGIGPYIDTPQTQYAPAFRGEAFHSISFGSTESQVASVLGPPLGRRYCSDGTICWDYTFPYNADASYLRRTLVFNSSGRLVDRYMGFVLGD
jgi:hypothetical protein